MGRSQRLYKKAKGLIPGGTQLFSKRPERLLPGLWPAYYTRAKGCAVWDLDGKRYIDASHMGVGSCILGYSDPDVDRAVKGAIENGTMSTLNCPEDPELAELLCKLHPWAAMARFARTGGEAVAVAVRIARTRMRRDKVLFCGYHGWHDWYLAANIADEAALEGHLLPGLKPRGVPRALKGTSIPFRYNDKEGFLDLIKRHKGSIAAVVMEPVRNHYPQKGFLELIRDITEKKGIALIFDEITAGWRLCSGGAHLKFKVYPDMAVFAKGMSNGYPMAAIIGRRDIMDAARDTFVSSTYWTERIGPVAALSTIKKLKKNDVPSYLSRIGKEVQEIWKGLSKRHNLKIKVSGIYPLSHFTFGYKRPLLLKTLFAQEMLKRGFLATTVFYASWAHSAGDLGRYSEAAGETFALISKAVKEGNPRRYLKGGICQSGFARLA